MGIRCVRQRSTSVVLPVFVFVLPHYAISPLWPKTTVCRQARLKVASRLHRHKSAHLCSRYGTEQKPGRLPVHGSLTLSRAI